MVRFFFKFFRKRFIGVNRRDDIDPDEIFLDSSNLPDFDVFQFEGRLIQPISKASVFALGFFFLAIVGIFLWRVGNLQILEGEKWAKKSENNRLAYTYLFPERGIIYDRNKKLLAWNTTDVGVGTSTATTTEFSKREYTPLSGFGHILGYVKYPQADSSGNYYKTEYTGEAGVEKIYNQQLSGVNGLRIVERDALLKIQTENIVEPPKDGEDLVLSIDERIQSKMYGFIESLVKERGFDGGAGIIMDIQTGEILSLTNYPEYSSSIMSEGKNRAVISRYNTDSATPYIDRIVSGRYTPGSIVKPFVALGALNEGVVTADKKILSTGKLVLKNPWDPKGPGTIFNDWKAHGWVNVKEALAVSSDVYFYEVGGGFAPDGQKGIGIENIKKYSELFGLGKKTGVDLPSEASGVIPDPEWKKLNFDGAEWNVGDTYHTAIGQYGYQVTPIQMVRGIAAIAAEGKMVTPHIVLGKEPVVKMITDIKPADYDTVKLGMRQAVLLGTAKGLNVDYVKVAAKTGTAQIGVSKNNVNAWVVGFFPADKPRYAFTVLMEHGPATNTVGALFIMRQLFDWMNVYTPEYFKEKI
jgi:penicillin-binding protein 2